MRKVRLAILGLSAVALMGMKPVSTLDQIKPLAFMLQTQVETYAVDHNGQYPPDLATLYQEAVSKKYWMNYPTASAEELKQKPWKQTSVLLMDGAVKPGQVGTFLMPSSPILGRVVYKPICQSNTCSFYVIEAQTPAGEPIIVNGKSWFVSNGED